MLNVSINSFVSFYYQVKQPVTTASKMGNTKLTEALEVLADQVASYCRTCGPIAVVGVRSRGDILAQRLITLLEALGVKIDQQGVLDITMYRDDLDNVGGQVRVRATDIKFDISDYTIILVDDVIFTGRTTRAALDALTDLGRAKAIRLAVLVDRGGRELPIQPDFVGLKQPQTQAKIHVRFKETDGEDNIIFDADGR
jgi:pyrimidine operon attenuation protein/uracil phosphoribosyltransferase